MTGGDEMSSTLVLMVLAGLLIAALFIGSQWKRARIRHKGTLVTAQVTQVQMWQDAPRADFSLLPKMIPFSGVRWRYEIRAEWTDLHTKDTYVFTSGVKKGFPGYQRGDYLCRLYKSLWRVCEAFLASLEVWAPTTEGVAHRSFRTLDDLEEAQAQRCVVLQDQLEVIRSASSLALVAFFRLKGDPMLN
jgi:hypothetical protein